MRHVTLTTPIK